MSTKEKAAAPASDRNEEGVNVDAKAMLIENGEKGTVIRYTDRVKVRLLKDTKYMKEGKVYSPHKVKADWLIKNKIAEAVKE